MYDNSLQVKKMLANSLMSLTKIWFFPYIGFLDFSTTDSTMKLHGISSLTQEALPFLGHPLHCSPCWSTNPTDQYIWTQSPQNFDTLHLIWVLYLDMASTSVSIGSWVSFKLGAMLASSSKYLIFNPLSKVSNFLSSSLYPLAPKICALT